MKISDTPLKRGKLIKRYKRFLTDVELDDGEHGDGHLPQYRLDDGPAGRRQPGVAVGVGQPQAQVRPHLGDGRGGERGRPPARVGLNTGLPNKLVEEAILAGKVDALTGLREPQARTEIRQELAHRHPAVERRTGRLCYVEVKNVTLSREGGVAEFPDAVTARGAKHLVELADMVREGHRAVMVYLAQRSDAETFRLAGDIDPAYLDAWRSATRRRR